MNISKMLKINSKIEVALINKNKFYSTRIEEVNLNEMHIAMPTDKGFPIIPYQNENIYGKIFNNGVMYQFIANFLYHKKNNIPIWVTSLPYNIKKIQFRNFVRLEISLPVEIEYMLNDETKIISTFTKNISGGGTEIILKEKLEIGIEFKIKLINFDISVIGKIVRFTESEKLNTIYWAGIEFTQINESDRKKIIQYIFKKQLEKR